MKRLTGFSILLLAGASAYAQTPTAVRLTLPEAESLALKNHPRVLAAQLAASAMNQRVVEARSPLYPNVAVDVTGSGANQQARIGAGFIAASRLFNRFADGVNVEQLITDWGRTSNLAASARFHADAAQRNVNATQYDILLAVNRSYFDVLRAQQAIRVAQQTVAARQTVLDQVTALANNKLRSELDVTFVEVSVAQAKLLLIQTQDAEQRAFAELTSALGEEQIRRYELTDQPMPATPPPSPEPLIAQAFGSRPELASLRLEREAAYRFERAERALAYPSVGLVGAAGYIPYINQLTFPRLIPNEYAGAAVNLHIPVFNGHLFRARRQEAHFRALEAEQRVRDEEQLIARDVREAWAGAKTAYQRLAVTAQMLRSATMSLQLAQGRYDLGLASVVELTQAQLNLTQADIENLSARYDYQGQYAALQYTLGTLR